MLTIIAFINTREIGRIFFHNLAIISKGKYKYEAWIDPAKKITVWHKRSDGWMKLTEKALKKLE
jgi:hypothetical protein